MLSKNRDEKVAKQFFIKAISSNGLPEKVTIDKSGSNNSALKSINFMLFFLYLLTGRLLKICVRDITYLNNIIEQGHRFIKRIVKPMKGFKMLHTATTTVVGIELHHMLTPN